MPFSFAPSNGVAQVKSTDAALRTLTEALSAFKEPPSYYRSAPLWVWNDRMTTEAIDDGLQDFQRKGIGGVFIHPRPGLITPYLSEEWFSLCGHAVTTGKRLGMKVWIYDENSYPSGFAGGHVPAKMPDATRIGLKMVSLPELPAELPRDMLLVLRKEATAFSDITPLLKSQKFGTGDYRIFSLVREEPKPWHGGFTYVDLLRPEVTREFIDVTMNAYKRAVGGEFGAVVPGVFQDEAEMRPAGEPGARVVSYTAALFQKFQKRWGYDLKLALPSLYDDIGEWRKVRHDYYATILDLFVQGWAKQYFDYCTANNLKLTGHYWEHAWPRPVMNPDNMACAAYAHIPGIDVLMNEYRAEPDGQFGNVRIVKEIRSVANQLGYERTLSETYGASGWDLTFADQKRIADWQFALGVNLVNQHLSYVTIKGARKRDHPLSFSYHEPWWKHYRVLADYLGRLSVALCAGEQRNKILVLEPTTTAWMYASPGSNESEIDSVGRAFQAFVNELEAAQIEYDLGSEDILRNHAAVNGRQLVVGHRSYDLLILPPGLENLDANTADLLGTYLAHGGAVISCVETPGYIDGKVSGRVNFLLAKHGDSWLRPSEGAVVESIHQLSPPALRFADTAGIPRAFPMVFHHRRVLEDAEILFLANTGLEQYSGVIDAPGKACDRWDPFTGLVEPYPATANGDRVTLKVSLPPSGSLLLCLKKSGSLIPQPKSNVWTSVRPRGKMTARRLESNVITLDYCDLTIGKDTEKDLYFYQAQQKAFRHHGLEQNPWDGAVQFESDILDKDKFSAQSGFTATFHFEVAQDATWKPQVLAAVERPELFHVSVNGKPVRAKDGDWWLDKAFGVYEISGLVRPGANSITVTSSPFTIHSELEPVYLLGDFAVVHGGGPFRMAPPREITRGSSWQQWGMPFYSGGVEYKQEFEITKSEAGARRFVVRLGKWNGVVSSVFVNGKEAGVIAFPPHELDITDMIQAGLNNVVITLYGSLKNTLGPHHNNPPLGRAWPSQFQVGAKGRVALASDYSTVPYGLFEDFELRSTTK
jgi:hypothetical protein